jgi:hypothetical protein
MAFGCCVINIILINKIVKKGKHKVEAGQGSANRDELSQAELQAGVNTVAVQSGQHPPLETAGGKNNGAVPRAFRRQRTNRT